MSSEKQVSHAIDDQGKEVDSAPKYETKQGLVAHYGPAKDGVELHPTPTSDPLDPLNWPRFQKWCCLGIVMWMYFLFTYITTTTVPSFPLLQEQYEISLAQVIWTVAIPALGLAIGPLIWSGLADIYGRRLIMIIGTVVALISTVWSAVAPNFDGYMAARFFQGLGVAPAATVGMAIINDLFFEHERGQKLGLWVLAIDMGLLVGPLIGGFITLVDQYWVAWLTAILFGVLLIAELFLLPETLYPRTLMLSRMPAQAADGETEKVSSDAYGHLSRTKKLPFLNFKPIPGVNPPKPWDTIIQFAKLFTFPNVSITVFFYCFSWYWWILSVITYLPIGYPQYTPEIQGLLFIGLIVGTLLSELFFSGTLSDRIMLKFAKKNGGVRVPEHRLWLFYPAIILSAIGLIVWGISIDKAYHWMVGQVAFALFAAGIQMGNTVCSAYIVDCYPLHGMSVITFYAVLLNLSAFISPWFTTPWVDGTGFTWSFATQGIILFFVMTPCAIGLQRFGARMRTWRGAPSWVSPEYSS